jgi:hypothetical protein
MGLFNRDNFDKSSKPDNPEAIINLDLSSIKHQSLKIIYITLSNRYAGQDLNDPEIINQLLSKLSNKTKKNFAMLDGVFNNSDSFVRLIVGSCENFNDQELLFLKSLINLEEKHKTIIAKYILEIFQIAKGDNYLTDTTLQNQFDMFEKNETINNNTNPTIKEFLINQSLPINKSTQYIEIESKEDSKNYKLLQALNYFLNKFVIKIIKK